MTTQSYNLATGAPQKSVLGHRPSRGEISLLAFYLWEESGRPFECDKEFWHEAEKRLLQQALGLNPPMVASVEAENHPY